MNERLETQVLKHKEPGPVITISRECGCQASLIAKMIKEKINERLKEKGKHKEWKWVNKEILRLASQELKIEPDKLKQLIATEDTNLIQNFFSSFTEKYYIHNTKVRKVIRDVIRNIAVEGNVVIVGRGSALIAWDIPKSLHIKLEAPLTWKTVVVSRRNDFSFEEAKNYVIKIDDERSKYRNYYKKEEDETINYHLSFNCSVMSPEEICDIILDAAELKQLF
jgi:cytidylate kinase